MDKPLIVQTTVETKQNGQQLADSLLRKRLAACCQISGPIESRYWWQGEIEHSPEYLLSLKTFSSLFVKVEQLIAEEHPYDVPEIIAMEITNISASYRNWMKEELQS
ncbi:divalent-cation tolerance protein CutA [Desulfopila sp. IMCC35008]|uniref:divalent-cation tolerance protein CutA n=1 Tax=Desulfopila sp. IMCC35008 TaxID=2653858 RepID=UPI0013D16DD9|nr:divalent-cation tolerance protein CutA [Desulfopila sp. IMCC35008]